MRKSPLSKSIAFLGVIGFAMSFATPAFAEPVKVEINPPLGYYLWGTEGEEYRLSDVQVAEENQGKECSISVEAHNGRSRHSGNQLVIRSAGNLAMIDGIEEESNLVVESAATMVVGEALELGLIFGPDGKSSLELTIDLDCSDPQGGSAGVVEVTTTTTTADSSPTTTANLQESEPVLSQSDPTSAISEVTAQASGGSAGISASIAPPAKAVAGSPAYAG